MWGGGRAAYSAAANAAAMRGRERERLPSAARLPPSRGRHFSLWRCHIIATSLHRRPRRSSATRHSSRGSARSTQLGTCIREEVNAASQPQAGLARGACAGSAESSAAGGAQAAVARVRALACRACTCDARSLRAQLSRAYVWSLPCRTHARASSCALIRTCAGMHLHVVQAFRWLAPMA